MCQVFRAVIGMELYFQKDECVHYMYCKVFVGNNLPVGLMNIMKYVHKLLKPRLIKICFLAQTMSQPSLIDLQLYFYSLMFPGDYIPKELVSTSASCNTGMRVLYAV